MRSSRNSKEHIEWLQQKLSDGNISAKERRRIVRQLYRANHRPANWNPPTKKPKIAKQTTLDSHKPSNSNKPSASRKPMKPRLANAQDPFVALSEAKSGFEPAPKSTYALVEFLGYLSLIAGVGLCVLFAYHPYAPDRNIDATLVVVTVGIAAVGFLLVFAYVPFLRGRGGK